MFSRMDLTALGLGGDPKAPAKPSSGGLTGADLELAHANREFDTADKVAQQATHDAYDSSKPRGAIAPAVARGHEAVETMQQSNEDQSNIRRLIAALAHTPRR